MPTTSSKSTRQRSTSADRSRAGEAIKIEYPRTRQGRARDDESEDVGPERVREIEDELRLAAGLTALREQAGLSQREVAKLIGVSRPRIAAIERPRNVTVGVLERYVQAVGGTLEVSVIKGPSKVSLLPGAPARMTMKSTVATRESRDSNILSQVYGQDDGRSVAAAAVAADHTKAARRSSAS